MTHCEQNEEPFHYLKRDSVLPSLTGLLSKEVPATAISAANKEVMECLKHSKDGKRVKKRRTYQKYSRKDKARIGNYAAVNGTSAAVRHFEKGFPNLKYTAVCKWKKAVANLARKSDETVAKIEERKRGRPSMLLEDITSHLTNSIRDAGGIINTAIVIAGLGYCQESNIRINEGYVVL